MTLNSNRILTSQPLQLISLDDNQKAHVNKLAVQKFLLSPEISGKEVRVCSIIGQYRTGKSYFMNELLDQPQSSGFQLGHEVDAMTKGIWAWAQDCGDHVLLALDTQGLGDYHDSTETQIKIMTLTLLLSSLMIVNTKEVLDENLMQKLLVFAEVSEQIKKKNGQQLLPDLCILLRDFSLGLSKHNNDLHDYANHFFSKNANGKHKSVIDVLQRLFPRNSRLVEALPRPALDVKQMEHNPSVITTDFKQKSAKLAGLVRRSLRPFVMYADSDNAQPFDLNCSQYAAWMQKLCSLVNDMHSFSDIPSEVDNLRQAHNNPIMEEALTGYKREMSCLELPVEDDELHRHHERAWAAASDLIMENAMGNASERQVLCEKIEDDIVKQSDDGGIVGGELFQFKQLNYKASQRECALVWEKTTKEVIESLKKGSSVFKSYEDAEQSVNNALEAYRESAVGPAYLQIMAERRGQLDTELTRLMGQFQLEDIEREHAEERIATEKKFAAQEAQLLESAQRIKELRSTVQRQEEQNKQIQNKIQEMEELQRRERARWAEEQQRMQAQMQQQSLMAMMGGLNMGGMSSGGSSRSSRRSSKRHKSSHSSMSLKFYKGGQFIPGGGRAPKGGCYI